MYFGYTREEFTSLIVEDLVPDRFSDNHVSLRDGFIKQAAPKTPAVDRELMAKRKDGSEFIAEIGLNPLMTDEGQVVVISVADITQRVRTEERYKLAIMQSPVGILIVDAEGRIVLSNNVLNDMFGYSEGDLLDQQVEMLLPEGLRQHHVSLRADYMENSDARQMGAGRVLFGVRKNGSQVPVDIALKPLKLSTGTEIIVQVVDITNRKKLEKEKREFEEKLQQTQKLESLGVMAGGIAHDFNNLLTGIVGYAEISLMDLPENSKLVSYMNHILNASHQAAALCDQMLAYSGGGKFIFEPIDLNEQVQASLSLIDASIPGNVGLTMSLGSNLPQITGDSVQLRQVIMNLVLNAAEAVGEKAGTVSLSTGIMDFEPETMTGFTPNEEEIPPGKYLFLTIADDGVGIEEEIRQRIFEPFYSTKFTGRGLGLPAVLGIVNNHKGTIRFLSEEGKGTSFTVLLPCDDQVLLNANMPESMLKKAVTVLIVDDESLVHDVAGETLRRAGFNVISAYDGREGLRKFMEFESQISLVILDLTMPYLTGDEVFRRIRKSNSEVKIAITSSYAEEMVMQQFQGKDVAGFLPKPISPSKLLKRINTILGLD